MRQIFVPGKIAAIGVALLSAALALAVYFSFVFSPFAPVRIGVIDAEQTASRRVVTITLPDVSSLRGQTAVLAFQLRNGGSEPKRIGLVRDGLPAHRVVVPPTSDIRWDVVLSPELVQTLDTPAADGARTLELTGDGDVWSLMRFEIRNHYSHWGDRVAIVPTPSSSKVQVSPSAFPLVVAALCLPLLLYLLYVRHTIVETMRSRVAIVTRGWTRHELTYERGAALLALAAIAIAQPIFDVVSNSPEFFPARSTPPASAAGAVAAICLGVPLALLALERTIRVVSRRAAATFHGIVLALLSAALVMPSFRRGSVVTWPWDILISACIGLAVALAYNRVRTIRQFLTALAPAALVVPALFFLNPGVRQSFLPSESAVALQTIERTPPIVLVVFDELPLNSLLKGDGQIDAERFPNFGALARQANWYRNASTVAYTTSYALPAILSGRYSTRDRAVPTLRYYPVNLFTALARHYNIFASMRFQELCPPRACQQNSAVPADTAWSLVSDLGLVWLHIVLPPRLTEELPPVVGEWADFGRTRETPTAGPRIGRGGVFAEFLTSIEDQPARLHFIHLVLPHMPFEYVPSGRRYRGPDYQTRLYKGKALFEGVSAAYADTLHQRHLAQVGFADRLVGDLIGRLRDVGAYDKALVIITADHGASYREGRSRRTPRPEWHNLSDILQVPLVIKFPAQQRGEIVDRMVEIVDIFPTILDVIGATASLRLDGRSLADGQEPERVPRTFFLRTRASAPPRPLGDLATDRAASLERKEQRFGRGDFTALYAPPGFRHVLGLPVASSGMRQALDVNITLNNPRQFETVKLARDPLPIYVRGALETSRADPLNVAVVVNGAIVAITQSYREGDDHTFGTLIPETTLREGHNAVAAFAVDADR